MSAIRTKLKNTITMYNNYRRGKVPLSTWFIGYFVGLRKELVRTNWLTGKAFGQLLWKALLIIILLAGGLFLINYGIVALFGETGIL